MMAIWRWCLSLQKVMVISLKMLFISLGNERFSLNMVIFQDDDHLWRQWLSLKSSLLFHFVIGILASHSHKHYLLFMFFFNNRENFPFIRLFNSNVKLNLHDCALLYFSKLIFNFVELSTINSSACIDFRFVLLKYHFSMSY